MAESAVVSSGSTRRSGSSDGVWGGSAMTGGRDTGASTHPTADRSRRTTVTGSAAYLLSVRRMAIVGVIAIHAGHRHPRGRGRWGASPRPTADHSPPHRRRHDRHRPEISDRVLGYPDRHPAPAIESPAPEGASVEEARVAVVIEDEEDIRSLLSAVWRRPDSPSTGLPPVRTGSTSSWSISRSSRHSTSTCPAWTASRRRSGSAPSARRTS